MMELAVSVGASDRLQGKLDAALSATQREKELWEACLTLTLALAVTLTLAGNLGAMHTTRMWGVHGMSTSHDV